MTTRLLEMTFSSFVAVTSTRNQWIKTFRQLLNQNKLHLSTSTLSITSCTVSLTNKRRMPLVPVIHAVAAHRHCQHLCPHPHLVSGIMTPSLRFGNDCSSSIRGSSRASSRTSSCSSDSTHSSSSEKNSYVPSASWAGSKKKSIQSRTSLFSFNFFGSSPRIVEESRRSYSKAKDKGIKKKSVVVIDENEMREAINVDSLKAQMESTLNQMKAEYASQLSVRGAAGALELLPVEFEGEMYPLQELAQIGRKNPQLIVLNLASLPDACQPVIKAIQESGMQLNPQQEGTTIYIPIPKVTREHRENLAKNAKTIFTKYKTSFQGVQNRFVKQCKSHKELSEDLIFTVTQQIMKMTEIYIADAEKLMTDKQKELLDTHS